MANALVKIGLYCLIGLVLLILIACTILYLLIGFGIVTIGFINFGDKPTGEKVVFSVGLIIILVFYGIAILIQVMGLVAVCCENSCLSITYTVFEVLYVLLSIYYAINYGLLNLLFLFLHLAITILMIVFIVSLCDACDGGGGGSSSRGSRRSRRVR